MPRDVVLTEQAINRARGLFYCAEFGCRPIEGWHDAEGDADPDDATFITVELSPGRWVAVQLDDFPPAQEPH